jgi:hypothetical protein
MAKDETSINQSDSQNAGDALSAGAEDSAKAYQPMSGGATAAPACGTLSGNTADPDADSIPTDAMLSFNCTDTQLGFTGMLSGTETVMDTMPNAIAWAFSANANLHASLTGPAGGSIVRDWDGTIVASQGTGLLGPYSLARTLDATTVFTGALGRSVTVTEQNDWTVSFTPTVAWAQGFAVTGGSLTATGTWNATVGPRSAMATLATPTPLTLTASCATRVTAGTLTASWTAASVDHTLTVAWTGCGTHTVTYAEH